MFHMLFTRWKISQSETNIQTIVVSYIAGKKKNPRKGAINAYIFIFKGTSYIKYLFKKNITGIYMEHLPVR